MAAAFKVSPWTAFMSWQSGHYRRRATKSLWPASQTISLQSPWTLLNHLGSTFCGSVRPSATHRWMLRDVCVPTGLSSWPRSCGCLKRPIHTRACELNITIPITGLTRRVSAAHLSLRRLFLPFLRRERLTWAKGEDTFNICCRFRLPLLERSG